VKQLTTIVLLVVGGVLAWRIADSLSSDAISMGMGILLGMLAGLPASLLLLYATRRRDGDEIQPHSVRHATDPQVSYPSTPPVIVLAGMGTLQQPGTNVSHLLAQQSPVSTEASAWSQPRPTREYRIIGERDEALEEW